MVNDFAELGTAPGGPPTIVERLPTVEAQRGTEVAALFYSLIESAKLCGVEPKAYLLQATHVALETPGTVTLPHALLSA